MEDCRGLRKLLEACGGCGGLPRLVEDGKSLWKVMEAYKGLWQVLDAGGFIHCSEDCWEGDGDRWGASSANMGIQHIRQTVVLQKLGKMQ